MMKKILPAILISVFTFHFSTFYCSAQPGSLDNSFGTGGKVVTSVGSGTDVGNCTAIQSDGKILVAGYSSNGSNNDFAIVRYNTNGTLDNAFGTGGKTTTAVGSGRDEGFSIAIQSDGKIVVAGLSNNGANNDFAVVRYTTAGVLDNTFGTGGKVTTAIGTSNEQVQSVAIQADGKIVACGYTYNGSNYDFALVRYTTAGALDNTFGTGGKVSTDFGGTADEAFAVAIQSDGKIVATGQTVQSMQTDFATVRYNSNGSPDNTFDTDGIVITDMSSDDEAFALAIQTDGKIVVAGYTNQSSSDIAIVRYSTSGSLDNTFGTGGTVFTDYGGSAEWAYGVKLQSNGKIVVGASYFCCSDYDFSVARYNSNGSLDTGFDTDGIVTTDFGGSNDQTMAVAIQADGKIILAGSSGSDFALARYTGGTVGIDETMAGSLFTVSPNPFSDELKISNLNNGYEGIVTLYDAIGNKILNQKTSSAETVLSTNGIVAGLYLLRVECEGEVKNYKVIKSR